MTLIVREWLPTLNIETLNKLYTNMKEDFWFPFPFPQPMVLILSFSESHKVDILMFKFYHLCLLLALICEWHKGKLNLKTISSTIALHLQNAVGTQRTSLNWDENGFSVLCVYFLFLWSWDREAPASQTQVMRFSLFDADCKDPFPALKSSLLLFSQASHVHQ